MLFSSFSTRSMVFAYFAKAQLPFSLFRDLFNDTAEFTLCYGLHDCSHLFQGYFIHSLSTLYYYNAPSLTTRLTGDYRDRTYTGKCSPALLDTHKKKRACSSLKKPSVICNRSGRPGPLEPWLWQVRHFALPHSELPEMRLPPGVCQAFRKHKFRQAFALPGQTGNRRFHNKQPGMRLAHCYIRMVPRFLQHTRMN